MAMRTSVTIAAVVGCLLTGCTRQVEEEPVEPTALVVTSWTDMSELFMEHPPFVAGEIIRFAVHLTDLTDFSAVNAGRPSIELTPESGGPSVVLPGSEPLRPGAFRVEGTLPPAGQYRWALIVDAPGLADRHDLGTTTVFADEPAAAADADARPADDPEAISYLKEQQWTSVFAADTVREAEFRSAVRVPATIQPLTGGEAIVAAPSAGRFAADTLVSIGAVVEAGQSLGRLEPRLTTVDNRATIEAAVTEARADLETAQAESRRAERLLADRAVPARRVDEARRAVHVADTRARAIETRLAQHEKSLRTGGAGNSFVLRAPIGGRVAEVSATLGASYEEGAPLFRIVRTDTVALQALVPAADARSTRDIESAALELPGWPEPLLLETHHRHDSGVIDPKTRALTVQFEVDNPGGQLLIGQTGTAVLYTRETRRVPAVPKSAVLMEAGRPYVFVQLGGELFARRRVVVSAREGDLVGLESGVQAGDRVVVRGAYDVQLASAATGLPAEGHLH